MDTPSDELKATLAEIVQAADEFLRRLQALGDRQPFGIESWLSQAESIMRLLQLDDEARLNDDWPFNFVLKSFDLRERRICGRCAAIEPDRRYLEACRRAREEDGVRPETPFLQGRSIARHGDNTGWRMRRSGTGMRIGSGTSGNCITSTDSTTTRPCPSSMRFPTIVFMLSLGKPPADLDTALMQVRDVRDRAADRLDKIENGDPETRRKLQTLQEKLAEMQSFERQLSELQAQLHDRRPDARFDAADWTSLYERLDEKQRSRILSEFWATDYETLRSELAKRAYADDPTALHPAARDYFETLWAFDAEQATLQLGGQPRRWCAEFIERKPKSVMLLQLPTNHLTLFTCGDVEDLVVSISTSDLARCKFSNVWFDVSN